jgi:hypothetical protein
MDLTSSEKALIKDYIHFHYHSPSNTNPEDFRRFNQIMFRAVKLNFFYTIGFSAVVYHLLHRPPRAIFQGYTSPGTTLIVLTGFSVVQFVSRFREEVYSEEALACAKKYQQSVDLYNDHFRRIYGNQ